MEVYKQNWKKNNYINIVIYFHKKIHHYKEMCFYLIYMEIWSKFSENFPVSSVSLKLTDFKNSTGTMNVKEYPRKSWRK